MLWLANTLSTGFTTKGVVKDDARAFQLYKRLAETGNADAQWGLGVAYLAGLGVPQNRDLAVHWYQLAARQNHKNSQETLRRLGVRW